MKDRARLIIPVWGERYVSKVLSITLPAVLAPGNLPALCAFFDVELVLVTESRLFETVRNANAFQAATQICAVRLVALDDLLTEVFNDYGMVLTYALFRGFADLGPRVTETYLVFLNADFVISDGALRHLVKLMRDGYRVIHAPSFRVVLEDVWPQLEAKVDAATGSLTLPPRELVKLALANKHPTVKARTVNQRLRHQAWMDQYYWYVDDDTLIGYQSPLALIAVKPEHPVTEPTMFWDYGFLPQAISSATPIYITDSDDYFMIEPQSRDTGREMINVGWFSLDDIARKESQRATQEHRESGRQLVVIHAGDLPADLDRFAVQSRVYMDDLYRRMSPSPASHLDHPILARWFEEASARRRGTQDSASQRPTGDSEAMAAPLVTRSTPRAMVSPLLGILRTIYVRSFGRPPRVSKLHPLWTDLTPVTRKIAAWRRAGESKILWVSSIDTVFCRILDGRVDTTMLLAATREGKLTENAPYDACLCELNFDELLNIDRLYSSIRPVVKNGGSILISVRRDSGFFDNAELLLRRTTFPSVDISAIHFFGTPATALLRRVHSRAVRSFPSHFLARALAVGLALVALAPAVGVANRRSLRRDDTLFSPIWTSLLIEFTVKRGSGYTEDRSERHGL